VAPTPAANAPITRVVTNPARSINCVAFRARILTRILPSYLNNGSLYFKMPVKARGGAVFDEWHLLN